MQLDAFAVSIPGRRANNEDAVCMRPELGLFVVADGMGGYEGGEIASAITIETIDELVRRTAGAADVTWPYKIDPHLTITENEVMVATRLANDRICARRSGVLDHMGSTVVVLRLVGDRVVIGHVGDSRIYRLRDGVLAQLTVDHSLVAQLIAAGMPVAEAAEHPYRHVVTRALGAPSAEPEVQLDQAWPRDVFLLCTDGLSEVLPPHTIATLLAKPAEAACRALVDAAYEAGSRDNISAIVVRVS